MDQNVEERPVDRDRGSTSGTKTRKNAVKIYILAAVEFWIAADAAVIAMHLVATRMSNWFVLPLVLAALLLAASATYAIAYHRLSGVLLMTKGELTTAGTEASRQ